MDPDGVVATLLEKSVTVNKAKEVGALVPVLFTKQTKPGILGAMSLDALAVPEPAAAGSLVVRSVELLKKDSKGKYVVPVSEKEYKARMYGFDDRYIAIDAFANAKKMTVKVMITPDAAGNPDPIDAGTLTLSVATKYPKITLKAGQLNLAFPEQTAGLTATSADGSKVTIRKAEVVDAKSKSAIKVSGSSEAWQFGLGYAPKKGSFKAKVWLDLEGYKTPYKGKDYANVTVKAVNTLPSVKLSAKSVKLIPRAFSEDPAQIQLVTGNKKVPFESGYKVKDVTASDFDAKGNLITKSKAEVEVAYAGGVISVKPDPLCKTGKALIRVDFEDGAKPLFLTLSVTVVNPANKLTPVAPSSKTKSLTVNTALGAGAKIADVPVTFGVANLALSDWKAVGAGTPAFDNSALAKAIGVAPGRNQATLTVKDQGALAGLLASNGADKSYKIEFFSPALDRAHGLDPAGSKHQKFAVTLKVTKKAPGMTLTAKGKVDIANPGSAVTVTLGAPNTTADISTVRLLAGKEAGAPLSRDFKVASVSGKTFKVAAAHKTVVPGVSQTVWVQVVLKNGVVYSNSLNNSKSLKITPSQTVGKARQSAKAVTLYKLDPLRGQTASLGLKTPANVKLGGVRLNQAALNGFKLVPSNCDPGDIKYRDGFRLEQGGSDSWAICFKDPAAPQATKVVNGKTTITDLKSSYKLKLELWAEGTYTICDDPSDTVNYGKPVALGYYNASGAWVSKSKPTYVYITVKIK